MQSINTKYICRHIDDTVKYSKKHDNLNDESQVENSSYIHFQIQFLSYALNDVSYSNRWTNESTQLNKITSISIHSFLEMLMQTYHISKAYLASRYVLQNQVVSEEIFLFARSLFVAKNLISVSLHNIKYASLTSPKVLKFYPCVFISLLLACLFFHRGFCKSHKICHEI